MNETNGLPDSSNESILPFNPWIFGIQWIAVALVVLFLLRWFDTVVLFDLFIEAYCGSLLYPLMWLVSGIMYGLIVGLMQWFLIYRYFNWSGKWIVATVIGMLIYYFLYGFISCSTIGVTSLLSCFPILGGLIIGLGQWFILRQTTNWAGWWIVANCLSEFTGRLILSTAISINFISWIEPTFSAVRTIVWIITTSVEQALLVACLVWLFYRNIKQEVEPKTIDSDDELLPPEASD